MSDTVKGYFDICSEEFEGNFEDVVNARTQYPTEKEIFSGLFESFSNMGQEWRSYDFKNLNWWGFDERTLRNFLIAGWRVNKTFSNDHNSMEAELFTYTAMSEKRYTTWDISKQDQQYMGWVHGASPLVIQQNMLKRFPKGYAFSEMMLNTKDFM